MIILRQKEFGGRSIYNGLSPFQQSNLRGARHSLAEQLLVKRKDIPTLVSSDVYGAYRYGVKKDPKELSNSFRKRRYDNVLSSSKKASEAVRQSVENPKTLFPTVDAKAKNLDWETTKLLEKADLVKKNDLVNKIISLHLKLQ